MQAADPRFNAFFVLTGVTFAALLTGVALYRRYAPRAAEYL